MQQIYRTTSMLKCDFNKIALQRHTGKQRSRTLEHLEDLGPLGTQDTWEPRTHEDPRTLRTQDPTGPGFLEDPGPLRTNET